MTQETAKRCISILEQLSLTPQSHDNASSSTAHLPKKKNEGGELVVLVVHNIMMARYSGSVPCVRYGPPAAHI